MTSALGSDRKRPLSSDAQEGIECSSPSWRDRPTPISPSTSVRHYFSRLDLNRTSAFGEDNCDGSAKIPSRTIDGSFNYSEHSHELNGQSHRVSTAHVSLNLLSSASTMIADSHCVSSPFLGGSHFSPLSSTRSVSFSRVAPDVTRASPLAYLRTINQPPRSPFCNPSPWDANSQVIGNDAAVDATYSGHFLDKPAIASVDSTDSLSCSSFHEHGRVSLTNASYDGDTDFGNVTTHVTLPLSHAPPPFLRAHTHTGAAIEEETLSPFSNSTPYLPSSRLSAPDYYLEPPTAEAQSSAHSHSPSTRPSATSIYVPKSASVGPLSPHRLLPYASTDSVEDAAPVFGDLVASEHMLRLAPIQAPALMPSTFLAPVTRPVAHRRLQWTHTEDVQGHMHVIRPLPTPSPTSSSPTEGAAFGVPRELPANLSHPAFAFVTVTPDPVLAIARAPTAMDDDESEDQAGEGASGGSSGDGNGDGDDNVVASLLSCMRVHPSLSPHSSVEHMAPILTRKRGYSATVATMASATTNGADASTAVHLLPISPANGETATEVTTRAEMAVLCSSSISPSLSLGAPHTPIPTHAHAHAHAHTPGVSQIHGTAALGARHDTHPHDTHPRSITPLPPSSLAPAHPLPPLRIHSPQPSSCSSCSSSSSCFKHYVPGSPAHPTTASMPSTTPSSMGMSTQEPVPVTPTPALPLTPASSLSSGFLPASRTHHQHSHLHLHPHGRGLGHGYMQGHTHGHAHGHRYTSGLTGCSPVHVYSSPHTTAPRTAFALSRRLAPSQPPHHRGSSLHLPHSEFSPVQSPVGTVQSQMGFVPSPAPSSASSVAHLPSPVAFVANTLAQAASVTASVTDGAGTGGGVDGGVLVGSVRGLPHVRDGAHPYARNNTHDRAYQQGFHQPQYHAHANALHLTQAENSSKGASECGGYGNASSTDDNRHGYVHRVNSSSSSSSSSSGRGYGHGHRYGSEASKLMRLHNGISVAPSPSPPIYVPAPAAAASPTSLLLPITPPLSYGVRGGVRGGGGDGSGESGANVSPHGGVGLSSPRASMVVDTNTSIDTNGTVTAPPVTTTATAMGVATAAVTAGPHGGISAAAGGSVASVTSMGPHM